MAATLADLLALLEDNSTGDISAADMRTIVTELWGQTVPTVAHTGRWQFSTDFGPPGAKELSLDNDPAFATVIRFDPLDLDGLGFSDLAQRIDAGSTVIIRDWEDPTNWAVYRVTGPSGEPGAYAAISVSHWDSAGPEGVPWTTVSVQFKVLESGVG